MTTCKDFARVIADTGYTTGTTNWYGIHKGLSILSSSSCPIADRDLKLGAYAGCKKWQVLTRSCWDRVSKLG